MATTERRYIWGRNEGFNEETRKRVEVNEMRMLCGGCVE